MTLSTITTAELTEHEIEAIKAVARFQCPHTKCEHCDLHVCYDMNHCIIDDAREILERNGVRDYENN